MAGGYKSREQVKLKGQWATEAARNRLRGNGLVTHPRDGWRREPRALEVPTAVKSVTLQIPERATRAERLGWAGGSQRGDGHPAEACV